jgi:hypothetical protein
MKFSKIPSYTFIKIQRDPHGFINPSSRPLIRHRIFLQKL